ncbi:hypothetical protein L6164_022855 [Bauhinia variegata]|uniref:Uncharacterized protein n=1 Tax=Bauhinia variegata TaxID=167791 RepID=A0ACB9MGC3_BAUVA|nr:hypothetical protein L6164_022855 [Bauhinia variegata]
MMQKQHQYNAMEPRKEEFHPASQSIMQEHLDSMYINTRPPDLNISENKPVNFSIQTGEEFAFEFMRDRIHPKKPVFPNIVDDPNYVPGYMDLKGILGISHTGSESSSDVSLLTKGEEVPKEFDRKSSSLHRDRRNYGSVRSIPRTSSNQDNGRTLHGSTSSSTSDRSTMKMKLLCSFGGRVLPRPSDGKLRYVGGETRIICIRKDISWQELMQKTSSIYNEPHVMKYQLPGEDLDALVTVSCDEDLRNMVEECRDLENREGSQKLRVFLFSMNELDDAQFGLGSVDGDSEIQYVVAVNGMDTGSRHHSTLHGASSSMHELDRQNIEREASSTLMESRGVGSSMTGNVNSSVAIQTLQPILPTSSNAYEAYPPYHSSQIIHDQEASQYPVHHGLGPSNNSAIGEIPISVPTHGLINREIINEGPPPSELLVQNSDLSAVQARRRGDSSIQEKDDHGHVFSLETQYTVPSQPIVGNLETNFSEASGTVAVPDGHLPTSTSRNKSRNEHYEEASSVVNAVNSSQIPKSVEYGLYSTSNDAFDPDSTDAEPGVIDLSCLEPPPLPRRVYYSERIPRDQEELLNRSTKSDDVHGSQILMSDLLSGFNQQNLGSESCDKLDDDNLSNLTAVSNATAKPLHEDDHAIDDGLSQLQKYKQLPDATSQMKSKLSQPVDSELKQVLASNANNKVAANEHRVLWSGNETSSFKDNHKNILVDETTGPEHPAFCQVSSVVLNDNAASSLPELNWEEASTRESNNDAKVQAQPFPVTGNISQNVPQGFPTDDVPRTAQGDILIDIDDRFPRYVLHDMFSKAIHSEGSSNIGPLPTDKAGLSLNMENHEPKRWSYFQKLAQEGFDNVSLIDQDHLGFSSTLRKGDSRSQQFVPLPTDGVSVGKKEYHLDIGEENQKKLPVTTRMEAVVLQSNYDVSQVQDNGNKHFDVMTENTRGPESEFEDSKHETQNVALPPQDPSLGDLDISTLQLINNDDLEELRELGSGTFGTVYHGKWRGSDVAIKRIKKICFTSRSSEQERLTVEFWREADILSKLHHPNVVAFYGVVQNGPGGTLATVTEFMVDSSLRHVLLRKDRYLDRRKRLIIAMDAAFGMEYLHSKNIVHFDLKCDNLLVNLKDPLRPICKVGDFGLSKIKRNTLVSGGVRGTLPWMAPELLNGSSNKVSEKVDVFSFGIVLWEILTGEEPYANMHYGAIIGGIVNNTLRPTIPSYCDPEWRTLMEQCWAPNPSARPSFTEIARRLRIMSAAAAPTKGQGHKAAK